MINLLFDLCATQAKSATIKHGGAKYGEVIFRRMIELGYKPICYYSSSRGQNPDIFSLAQNNGIALYDIETKTLADIVEENKIDKIFSCLPTDREFNFGGCHVVGTIHGLREVETPYDPFIWKYRNKNQWKGIIKMYAKKFLHLKKWEKYYLNLARNTNFEFITVSNHSAFSFKSYYPAFRNKEINVYYSPSTSSKNPIVERKEKNKYFLMVSGNRWLKNNLRAIMALDRLFSNGYLKDFHAITTGVSDSKIFRYKISNPDKFTFLGYIEDNELEQLYHDAYAFIYPSLNEGFGYPPLEAMRYGIPVLSSPFSSISEVCEGAVLYFNPFSVEEIMNRILMITNDDIYAKHSLLSLEQYQKITKKQKEDLDRLINYLYS